VIGPPARQVYGAWVTAAEVGEYVYCPRAAWYRRHPPEGGPSEESVLRARAGDRYHATYLNALEARERSPANLWAWLAAAIGLVGIALALGLGA
jgi:CRISPR/Cas system-associated exonuclease Cas4 (RecB family)